MENCKLQKSASTFTNAEDKKQGCKNDAKCLINAKEVCNGGVACSLLKLESLEKTVIASLFRSGLPAGTIFLQKKRCHILFLGTTGYAAF